MRQWRKRKDKRPDCIHKGHYKDMNDIGKGGSEKNAEDIIWCWNEKKGTKTDKRSIVADKA